MSTLLPAYTAGTALLAPALRLMAGRRLRAGGVGEARLPERSGHATLPRPPGRLAWVHAASIGESLSVLPVVERLVAVGVACLVTTVTATSAQVLGQRLPPGALHQFAPLDVPASVRRFLRHWRPDLAVTVESEVWPNALLRSSREGIPLVLLNARLSAGSLRAWGRAPRTAARVFRLFDRIVAQTPGTADALVALGADPARVLVGGNLKAAAGAPPADVAELTRLGPLLAGPLWAAVSTHRGEEEAVLDAHARLLLTHPGARLILAPRHPERGDEVEGLARARGLPVARRSRGEAPTGVILADTLGETGLWFRLAPVAFLGGSLVPAGGHNPWEPAACGAAVLTGPGVANVEADVAALVAAGGAAVVEGAGLAGAVAALWDDPSRLAGMREAARRTAGVQEDAVEAVAADLLALMARPRGGIRDPRAVAVIAPNLKRRRSGVTSTILRLVPVQAQDVAIAAVGPSLPAGLPRLRLLDLLTMPREGPAGPRVWHARRNVEMLAGLVLRGLLGKRLRLVFTSAAQRRHSGYTRWLIRRMDAVVATSSRSASFLEVPARVVTHGVDTALFSPPADRAALRAALGLEPAGLLLGSFGRLRPQKGTDLLVGALLDVLPRHPDARAILMGGVTADQRAFVGEQSARVAAAGLAARILFLPEDPAWDIARWFGALDLYVAPPRVEGFGLTPLEAMACGVPVVASRAGAFEDIVTPEVGALVPAGDGPALAAALDAALSDRSRLAAWAAAARPHVLARHRIEDEAAALNALYAELQGQPRLGDARIP